jgi:hypothetical protein
MKMLLLLYVDENLLECNELRRIEEEQKVKECRIFLPYVLVFCAMFYPLISLYFLCRNYCPVLLDTSRQRIWYQSYGSKKSFG